MAEPSETTVASRTPTSESELLGAVRALSEQVGELQAELQSLRSASRPLPPGQADAPGWEVDAPARRDASAWMRSVASPAAARPAVPRLLLEILFLVAVAVLAAVARLDTPLVVGHGRRLGARRARGMGDGTVDPTRERSGVRQVRRAGQRLVGRPPRAPTFEVTAADEPTPKPPPAAD